MKLSAAVKANWYRAGYADGHIQDDKPKLGPANKEARAAYNAGWHDGHLRAASSKRLHIEDKQR